MQTVSVSVFDNPSVQAVVLTTYSQFINKVEVGRLVMKYGTNRISECYGKLFLLRFYICVDEYEVRCFPNGIVRWIKI